MPSATSGRRHAIRDGGELVTPAAPASPVADRSKGATARFADMPRGTDEQVDQETDHERRDDPGDQCRGLGRRNDVDPIYLEGHAASFRAAFIASSSASTRSDTFSSAIDRPT